MAWPISEKSKTVISYCEKYPADKHPDHSLVRRIIAERPEFSEGKTKEKAYENVRQQVRYFRGHHGVDKRSLAKRKDMFSPLDYNVNKNNTYLENKDSDQYKAAQKRKLGKSKYYIITCAQNNSKVNDGFWANILAYSKFLGAEIHVILNRYKNPTSTFDSSEDSWPTEILPYADAKRHFIHKKLELLSDIKIQPTAANPLSGMEGISGGSSCIFGHPKIQMKVIPALEGYEPKMMFTTGSVTKPNYTDSKVGKKGEFHHVYGFVIVEIKDNETFFIRQVTVLKNGSFNDLVYSVKNQSVKKVNKIVYFNVGDKHLGSHCPIVEKKQEELLNYFKPDHTIIHDIFNGTSVNHYNEKDPIKKYALQLTGDNLIKREVENMFTWVSKWLKYNLVIIASNHNDWVDRYIKSMDWKKDIPNSVEYMRFAQILLSGNAKNGLIPHLLSEKFGKKIRTIGRSDKFCLGGIELSQHGDVGPNGAKGSLSAFRRLSTKMDVMHTHTPARADGVMYGGTSSLLRQDYIIGASNHLPADIICHLDGKRQHIFYMGKSKEFTTFKLK
jgi:hypothetical protein